jgi:heterodisulfide reductase subunit A
VATGYDLYPREQLGEYGYGKYPDVIDGLQYERLISASGPTDGTLRRPSDGRIPKEVVFVQCAGSRDPENALSYCSKICCMYTAKHAMLYAHRVPDGRAHVFYIDVRSAGKGYEEFVQRAIEDGVQYLRGKVSRVFQEDGKVMVWGTDTVRGHNVEIAADMVVLATGIVPSPGSANLSSGLGLETDSHGFFVPSEVNLRPMETTRPGIYLAGVAEGPRDIPETVAQASGAAAKVISLFNRTGASSA